MDERSLSPRQREVLVLYARGYHQRDVATELRISTNTVRVHLRDILQALGVHTTVRAVVVALARGEIFAYGEDVFEESFVEKLEMVA